MSGWAEAFSDVIMGGVGEGAGDLYDVETDCATHGRQKTGWVVPYGAPAPRAEDAYPPVCPLCDSYGPQAKVVSIRRARER